MGHLFSDLKRIPISDINLTSQEKTEYHCQRCLNFLVSSGAMSVSMVNVYILYIIAISKSVPQCQKA